MIDYGLLDSSLEHYKSFGFERVEAPWLVTEEIDKITRPADVSQYTVESKGKNFVASAEQSFLYQYIKGYLPKGRFQSITPCVRDESFNETHTKYFLKNELIVTDDVSYEQLEKTIDCALLFFARYFERNELQVAKFGDSAFDIICKGVELGSYGIREHKYLKWIYATGCAEPRTSNLMVQHGIS